MKRRTAALSTVDVEPVNKDVAERIGELLAMAVKGEISSIAYAVVYRDGNTGNGWSELHNYSLMIGGVRRLEHKLIQAIYDE